MCRRCHFIFVCAQLYCLIREWSSQWCGQNWHYRCSCASCRGRRSLQQKVICVALISHKYIRTNIVGENIEEEIPPVQSFTTWQLHTHCVTQGGRLLPISLSTAWPVFSPLTLVLILLYPISLCHCILYRLWLLVSASCEVVWQLSNLFFRQVLLRPWLTSHTNCCTWSPFKHPRKKSRSSLQDSEAVLTDLDRRSTPVETSAFHARRFAPFWAPAWNSTCCTDDENRTHKCQARIGSVSSTRRPCFASPSTQDDCIIPRIDHWSALISNGKRFGHKCVIGAFLPISSLLPMQIVLVVLVFPSCRRALAVEYVLYRNLTSRSKDNLSGPTTYILQQFSI